MKNHDRQPETVDDLIVALESAKTGSRTLDVQLAFRLGQTAGALEGTLTNPRLPAKWRALGDFPAIAKIMLDEGFSWQSVCDVLDCEAPPYTTSLDAAVPGESIVFVIWSAKRDRWGAIHKTDTGEEIFGWGATEILARRTAALKGWKATAAATEEAIPPAAEPDEFPADDSPQEFPAGPPERHKYVINGEHRASQDGKSLEERFAEQEDRDWEILF